MARTIQNTGTADTGILAASRLLAKVFPSPRDYCVRLYNGTALEADNSRPLFTIAIREPGSVRRMFSLPVELSLAEAYIRGDFDIEGDMVAAFRVFDGFSQNPWAPGDLLEMAQYWGRLPVDPPTSQITRGPLHLSGAQHSRERDRAAIQYHYDVGNEFYALWLDRRMNYSCAYFKTGKEDIDTAQEQKLEHICRKLRLKPGETLLDIGCGWGGLVIYAAQQYGVKSLGVTLSERQAQFANAMIAEAGLGDHAAVKLLDYRDLDNESFDKAVSVGMFEHVGRSHLPEYFAQVYRLLKGGGLFLNHGIASHPYVAQKGHRKVWDRLANRYVLGSGQFSQRYIFPDGELVPVSEVNVMAEHGGFEVRDVENLREHYALTLRQWVAGLEMRRDAAIRLVGESIYRTWKLYMTGSVYGFESGHTNVNQTLLAKMDQGHSNVPMTRADLYA
jgi:cyclopropane-fatty-acyl-phospholipid synthase